MDCIPIVTCPSCFIPFVSFEAGCNIGKRSIRSNTPHDFLKSCVKKCLLTFTLPTRPVSLCKEYSLVFSHMQYTCYWHKITYSNVAVVLNLEVNFIIIFFFIIVKAWGLWKFIMSIWGCLLKRFENLWSNCCKSLKVASVVIIRRHILTFPDSINFYECTIIIA